MNPDDTAKEGNTAVATPTAEAVPTIPPADSLAPIDDKGLVSNADANNLATLVTAPANSENPALSPLSTPTASPELGSTLPVVPSGLETPPAAPAASAETPPFYATPSTPPVDTGSFGTSPQQTLEPEVANPASGLPAPAPRPEGAATDAISNSHWWEFWKPKPKNQS